MANRVDANRRLFVRQIILKRKLSRPQIRQLLVDLLQAAVELLLTGSQVVGFNQQTLFDMIVHQIDAFPVLAMIKTFLCDVQRRFQVLNCLLHVPFGVGQLRGFGYQSLQLGVDFISPKRDVSQAFAESSTGIALTLRRSLVSLAHHSNRFGSHSLRMIPVGVGLVISGDAMLRPFAWREARVERSSRCMLRISLEND